MLPQLWCGSARGPSQLELLCCGVVSLGGPKSQLVAPHKLSHLGVVGVPTQSRESGQEFIYVLRHMKHIVNSGKFI